MENRYEKETGAESRAEENRESQSKQAEYVVRWEDDEGAGESASRKRHRKRRFRLTGSIVVKTIVFFLLSLSCLLGGASGLTCMYMESYGFYTNDLNSVMMRVMVSDCLNIVYGFDSFIEQGDMKAVSDTLRESNLSLQLIDVDDNGEETMVWDSRNGYESELTADFGITFHDVNDTVRINNHTLKEGEWYLFRVYIDPEFPEKDNFSRKAEVVEYLYEIRYAFIAMTASGILVCLLCFLFLICSAGHRNGREGIVPGVLTRIPLDILTAIFGGGAVVIAAFMESEIYYNPDLFQIIVLSLGGTCLVIWLTFYFMDIALRVKCGRGLRYSLIYMIVRWLAKALQFLGRELVVLVGEIPLVVTTLNVYLGICILELMGVLLFVRNPAGIVLWLVEKVVLLFGVIYIALMCRKLLKASQKLADGEENYRVNTARMFGAFRKHGENLNSLGLGISRAVEARMKSERMKTELISNVSHDLKTPLTSIINYADLIWEEVDFDGNVFGGQPSGIKRSINQDADEAFFSRELSGQQDVGEVAFSQEFSREMEEQALPAKISVMSSIDYGKIREYAEVLLRQSRRLKKLLEDLVEASKATTGNLEVNLEPCEVGVLLSQAVGEYQQRMEEKHLELIARQPQEAVTVLADGRRLWRVFENLLNNICKYAQENSRVYLNVEAKENAVQIIFRNMSKYPLDISAEELEERFVRGDKSRHMEGNGLGLSITRSLVELQNGRMEIVIDGDLFKAILCFPLYSRGQ